MSICGNVNVECPFCHSPATLVSWSSVNSRQNPEIKELIVDGKFWETKCPACNHEIEMESPLLYHNPDRKYMIQYEPGMADSPREARLAKAAELSAQWGGGSSGGGGNSRTAPLLRVLSEYRYRLAVSHLELAEKILIFDSGLDDISVEMLKLKFGKALSAQGQEISMMLFAGFDPAGPRIGMSVFLTEKKEWSQIGFDLDGGVLETVRNAARSDPESQNGTAVKYVDAEYAGELQNRG